MIKALDVKGIFEVRVSPGHGQRIIKNDSCLLSGGGKAIYISSQLAVCAHHIERNARAQGTFSVAPGYFYVSLSEPPFLSLLIYPAKNSGEYEALPVLELDRFSGQLTLNMVKAFNELANPVCLLLIEDIREIFSAFFTKVFLLSLTGKPCESAR